MRTQIMKSIVGDHWRQNILVIVLLFLANLRAAFFWTLFPDTRGPFAPAWLEISLWLILVGLMFVLLTSEKKFFQYLNAWRGNWFVWAFIAFCIASLIWSVSFPDSLYRTLNLILATLVGAYIGVSYDKAGLLEILFWFGAIAAILTVTAVQLMPELATMPEAPYYGAWQGIFWHRNHLGSIFALLNMVFLIRFVDGIRSRQPRTVLDGIFYLLSLVIVFFSRSATGYILIIFLSVAVALIWGWIRILPYLHRVHYVSLLAFSIIAGLVFFLKFDVFMGLFGRTSSLTGRVPLWIHLINEYVMRHLWFGYGFGAFWTIETIRTGLRDWAGWLYPVVIGDNGFLDILLHVGLLGLTLFLIILVVAIIRSFRYAITDKTLYGFFPFLFLLYAVVANITFSMFLETESFIWILLIAVLFLTTGSTLAPNITAAA